MMPRLQNHCLITPSAAANGALCAAFAAILAPFVAHAALPASPFVPAARGEATAHVSRLYRLVKRFDFDERQLGNFDDVPMHWVRLEGPGLPKHNRGQFDAALGADAPPCFRLSIAAGGSVGFEYRGTDLAAVPGSDYVLNARVRVERLRHARAFLAAYFVDRFEQELPGSKRVSNLATATGDGPPQWQTLELQLPGDFDQAWALRIQLWILQDHVWKAPEPTALDPIVERDVLGSAAFDDLVVYRMPRARLAFSNPAGLVAPGRRESILVYISNAAPEALAAELTITDIDERVVLHRPIEIPPESTRPPVNDTAASGDHTADPAHHIRQPALSSPVPDLPPGVYTVTFQLRSGRDALLTQSLRFAVLLPLPAAGGRGRPDMGVDVGPWRGHDLDGLVRLMEGLDCRQVKVGVPLFGALDTPQEVESARGLAEFLRRMAERQIDATAVIWPPQAVDDPRAGPTVRDLIAGDASWRRELSPVFAHFAGLLATWQLGDERRELDAGRGWTADQLRAVRRLLGRFVTAPHLIVPQGVTLPPAGPDVPSILVPPDLPARAIPAQLAHLGSSGAAPAWLAVAPDERPTPSREQRLADLARRVILAKATATQRVYLPAPLRSSPPPGAPRWEPTDAYPVLRTLVHVLDGKRATATLTTPGEGVVVIFEGGGTSCAAAWTWQPTALTEPAPLYLGGKPEGIDLWGRPVPIPVVDGRARLPLGPLPILVLNIDAGLAKLPESMKVAPTMVQAHNPEPRPVLSFENTFPTPITGTLELEPPEGWGVSPAVSPISLQPGEKFSTELGVSLPPRPLATERVLRAYLTLVSPRSASLVFEFPMTIGVRGVRMDVATRWDGSTLLVEQSLQNETDQPLSFTGFCEAPRRAHAERAFLRVQPGARALQTYEIRNATDLVEAELYVGLKEIHGPRRIDQLVPVAP